MISLTIMNETGHTELTLDAQGVIEQINTHPTHWVFIDGELTSREQIAEIAWDDIDAVMLSPAIVGGNI
jgi:nicotinate-nucleotide pyrophosphorylase|tara:strand:- start:203 stop:409 length:207 start_codon:yes stop_codon:yes gene_type:complete